MPRKSRKSSSRSTSNHFTIAIKVTYDSTTVPVDMESQLAENIEGCVSRGELFNDTNQEAVVDDWSVAIQSS